MTVAGIWGYARFLSPVLEQPADVAAGQARVEADAADSTSTIPALASANADPASTPPVPAVRERTTQQPRLTAIRPEPAAEAARGERAVEPSAREQPVQAQKTGTESAERAAKLLAAGMQALARDEFVAARKHLSQAVTLGLAERDLVEARAALVRIGTATIFGGAIVADDPLVRSHVVSPGESLVKIASMYDVTADLIAAINNIADKNLIRAGQTLKVVQGPFHARVDKKTFRMDVYLQDVFVRQYAVGLGANDSTPTGDWIVGTKLTNPTYYPPRGGSIIAADDPENPLGEHWIELIGVSGNAAGQERYGIHGTIEPDSIGKSESLGCIRMHNQDVAEVFALLVPKKSNVQVR